MTFCLSLTPRSGKRPLRQLAPDTLLRHATSARETLLICFFINKNRKLTLSLTCLLKNRKSWCFSRPSPSADSGHTSAGKSTAPSPNLTLMTSRKSPLFTTWRSPVCVCVCVCVSESTPSRQQTVSAATANLAEAPPRSPAPVSTGGRSGVGRSSDRRPQRAQSDCPTTGDSGAALVRLE